MRVKLQLVMCSDDGRDETVTDLVTLKKDSHRIEQLGLSCDHYILGTLFRFIPIFTYIFIKRRAGNV